jgi:hypothetical protein
MAGYVCIRRSLRAVALLAPAWLSAGAAMAQPGPDFAARMRDIDETLLIERQLSDALARKDQGAVGALAAQIEAEDGANIRAFIEGIQQNAPAVRELALRFGPCENAGLLIRSIAFSIGNGQLKGEARDETFLTNPRRPGNEFAENLARCEMVIRKNMRSQRSIGSACVIDGNCDDDED